MPRKSITVEFWERVFRVLSYMSIFKYVRQLVKGKDKNWWASFIDIWILTNLLLSVLSVFFVRYFRASFITHFFVWYGLLRVFEIVVHQINVLLFDEYRAKRLGNKYSIRGFRRMIVNLLTNFVEIIFWFATSYAMFYNVSSDTSIMRLLFNSFSIMTTFGQSNFETATVNDTKLFILWFQSVAGLLMTLLSIARFIGLLPQVESIDEFEK